LVRLLWGEGVPLWGWLDLLPLLLWLLLLAVDVGRASSIALLPWHLLLLLLLLRIIGVGVD
jgi:hypothetical protein